MLPDSVSFFAFLAHAPLTRRELLSNIEQFGKEFFVWDGRQEHAIVS
jgi:hypothetical protein